jgi:hypothetical protein
VMGGRGPKACVALKEAWVEPLMIADVVVQVLAATLWAYSMRAVAFGAQLRSARVGVILLEHHYRLKDWRYLQAITRACYVCFVVDGVA